jgi:hypothetical protein
MHVDEYKWRVEQLDFKVEAYLREKGWKHTSDTPGSYWMWEREIGGRVYLVERATALRIQSHHDARERWPDGPPSSRRPGVE